MSLSDVAYCGCCFVFECGLCVFAVWFVKIKYNNKKNKKKKSGNENKRGLFWCDIRDFVSLNESKGSLQGLTLTYSW